MCRGPSVTHAGAVKPFSMLQAGAIGSEGPAMNTGLKPGVPAGRNVSATAWSYAARLDGWVNCHGMRCSMPLFWGDRRGWRAGWRRDGRPGSRRTSCRQRPARRAWPGCRHRFRSRLTAHSFRSGRSVGSGSRPGWCRAPACRPRRSGSGRESRTSVQRMSSARRDCLAACARAGLPARVSAPR